jgi:hypothetical protein
VAPRERETNSGHSDPRIAPEDRQFSGRERDTSHRATGISGHGEGGISTPPNYRRSPKYSPESRTLRSRVAVERQSRCRGTSSTRRVSERAGTRDRRSVMALSTECIPAMAQRKRWDRSNREPGLRKHTVGVSSLIRRIRESEKRDSAVVSPAFQGDLSPRGPTFVVPEIAAGNRRLPGPNYGHSCEPGLSRLPVFPPTDSAEGLIFGNGRAGKVAQESWRLEVGFSRERTRALFHHLCID